jgi:hypothetical protein
MAKKEEYSKLLRDPRWQKRRLDIMGKDEFTCQICYNRQETLNVHHLIYFPGRDPWDYDDKHLITLCEPCHERQRNINIKEVFADLSINNTTVLLIGFLLKKLIPEFVNNDRCTDQAIWSILYDKYADEFRSGNFQQELKEYNEKYLSE